MHPVAYSEVFLFELVPARGPVHRVLLAVDVLLHLERFVHWGFQTLFATAFLDTRESLS